MAWWNVIVKPVADVFCKALDVVDKIVPDKDLAEKLKFALRGRIQEIAHNEFMSVLKAQTQIITTEAKGGWLQRNWRPMLMCEFGVIIANNYIVAPYVGMIAGAEYAIQLQIPPDMWGLLKLGVSGYVVGRSMEKVADGTGVRGIFNKLMEGKK
jgi:hypothetical protein